MSAPYYTIVVSGESFRLTRKQLLSEPDNLFEEMAEACQGGDQVEIEEEPLLFKLIQAHLRGYDILPIAEGYIPYMTKDGVLKNLLKLAGEYGLDILAGKIKAFQASQVGSHLTMSQKKYMLKRRKPVNCPPPNQSGCQFLGKEEYLAMFHGFTTCSRKNGQWLVLDESRNLREGGYSISMSWNDYDIEYALLVSDDPSISDEATPRPAQAN